MCLYHWCLLAELLPWHREAGQGYGSELLIDDFSNSVNEIELVRLHILLVNHTRLLSFAFEHIVPKGWLCALLILVKLFMLDVWVQLA